MKFLKSGLIFLFLLVAVTANAADNLEEAKTFWKSFRRSVLTGKTVDIASMARFPFEVRGVDDSDPVKRYSRQKFPLVFNQVLSQHVFVMSGKEIVEKTMLQVIKEKTDLTASDFATPDFFTVELFSFHLIKGRWLFTRAYLEDT